MCPAASAEDQGSALVRSAMWDPSAAVRDSAVAGQAARAAAVLGLDPGSDQESSDRGFCGKSTLCALNTRPGVRAFHPNSLLIFRDHGHGEDHVEQQVFSWNDPKVLFRPRGSPKPPAIF